MPAECPGEVGQVDEGSVQVEWHGEPLPAGLFTWSAELGGLRSIYANTTHASAYVGSDSIVERLFSGMQFSECVQLRQLQHPYNASSYATESAADSVT